MNSNYMESYFRSNDSDLKYNVDIAFVVDATKSMDNQIDTVKKMIPEFYQEVKNALKTKNKSVDVMRARVVFFRDFAEYMSDHNAPLMQTKFYVLSDGENDQSAELARQIASIEAIGGGDIPEDGLEGLACAMKSDWCPKTSGHKRRHIIAFFTDAPTHEIGYARDKCNVYPKGMPKNFDELTQWWGNESSGPESMDYNAKRLIMFIPKVFMLPNDDGYRQIVEGTMPWENCDIVEVDPREGVLNVSFKHILDRIVNSI